MNQLNDDQIQNKLKSCNLCFIVTRDDIMKAVPHMKAGKRERYGLFSSDCIINAPDSLYVHFALLISAMFTHGLTADDSCGKFSVGRNHFWGAFCVGRNQLGRNNCGAKSPGAKSLWVKSLGANSPWGEIAGFERRFNFLILKSNH